MSIIWSFSTSETAAKVISSTETLVVQRVENIRNPRNNDVTPPPPRLPSYQGSPRHFLFYLHSHGPTSFCPQPNGSCDEWQQRYNPEGKKGQMKVRLCLPRRLAAITKLCHPLQHLHQHSVQVIRNREISSQPFVLVFPRHQI